MSQKKKGRSFGACGGSGSSSSDDDPGPSTSFRRPCFRPARLSTSSDEDAGPSTSASFRRASFRPARLSTSSDEDAGPSTSASFRPTCPSTSSDDGPSTSASFRSARASTSSDDGPSTSASFRPARPSTSSSFRPARTSTSSDDGPSTSASFRPARPSTSSSFRPARDDGPSTSASFRPARDDGPSTSASFRPARDDGPSTSSSFRPSRPSTSSSFRPSRPSTSSSFRPARPSTSSDDGPSTSGGGGFSQARVHAFTQALARAGPSQDDDDVMEEEGPEELEEPGPSFRLRTSSASSTSSQAERRPRTEAQIQKKVNQLVKFLLVKDQKKVPIRRVDMVKTVLQDYKDLASTIIERAARIMEEVFGLELREVDERQHAYILINKLDRLDGDGMLEDENVAKMGLLMVILSLIFMKGNAASESLVWDVLRKLRVDPEKNHHIFGDVQKLLKDEFVHQRYLDYNQVPHSDPPEYEFVWGPRAFLETSKMQVLRFVAKIQNREPSSWVNQYNEALLEEMEAANAAGAASAAGASAAGN